MFAPNRSEPFKIRVLGPLESGRPDNADSTTTDPTPHSRTSLFGSYATFSDVLGELLVEIFPLHRDVLRYTDTKCHKKRTEQHETDVLGGRRLDAYSGRHLDLRTPQPQPPATGVSRPFKPEVSQRECPSGCFRGPSSRGLWRVPSPGCPKGVPDSADCKRGRRKGATSKNVKNRQ